MLKVDPPTWPFVQDTEARCGGTTTLDCLASLID